MFRQKKKVVVEVSAADLRLIYQSLIALRNALISEGKYADPVNELLAKILE